MMVYAHAVSQYSDDAIEVIWARALTDDALFNNFDRYLAEPKGWKKAQKQALLDEVNRRVKLLHNFKRIVNNEVVEFRQGLNNRLNGDVLALKCAQAVEQAVNIYFPIAPERGQSQEEATFSSDQ